MSTPLSPKSSYRRGKEDAEAQAAPLSATAFEAKYGLAGSPDALELWASYCNGYAAASGAVSPLYHGTAS